MADPQKTPEKTWRARIKDRFLDFLVDKAIWGLAALLISALGAGGYFGYEHWGSPSKEQAKAIEKVETRTATDTNIPKGDLGYRRISKYLGASSKFEHFTDGTDKAPFYELQQGAHEVDFSVKGKLVEGGYLYTSFGGTPHYWKASGKLHANFTTDSLYALIADGQENFLEESILPIVREEVNAHLDKATEKTEVEAEVSDSSMIGEPAERLTRLVSEGVSSRLEKEFGLKNISISFDSLEKLDEAQLKRENLESLETADSATLVHFVGKPVAVADGSSGMIAVLFFVIAFIVLIPMLKIIF